MTGIPAGLLDHVAAGLLYGTLLAGLTALAAVTVLRGARPALMVGLWTVVLAKFVIPFGPEMPFSFSGLLDSLMVGGGAEQAQSQLLASALIVRERAPDAASAGSWVALHWVLLAAYLLVVGALLTRRFASLVRSVRTARSLPAATGRLAELVPEAAHAVGMRRAPDVRIADDDASPYMVGIVRPVVVMPAWLADRPDEARAVLVHELAHIRRGDAWLRVFQIVVGSLLFFWPVIWFVNRRLDVAREIACDEWAIARGRVAPRVYAQLLVSLARRSRGRVCAAAVALVSRRHPLEVRVDRLLSARQISRLRPRLSPIAGISLLAWTVISLGGSGVANATIASSRLQCVIEDGVIEQILAEFPEADSNGDGFLSRSEICAHQDRMKRRVVDEAFASMGDDWAWDVASMVVPSADEDGDGDLNAVELEGLKDHIAMSLDPKILGLDPVEFPGQVCEEASTVCTYDVDYARGE